MAESRAEGPEETPAANPAEVPLGDPCVGHQNHENGTRSEKARCYYPGCLRPLGHTKDVSGTLVLW